LDSGEIVVHMQPQMELRSGRIVAAEALARWQHPDCGVLAPLSFIPWAEELGLAERLTDVVLIQSLRCIERLDELAVRPLNVAVNLSAGALKDAGIVPRVYEILERSSVAAKRLTLEVTETALIDDPAVAEGVLSHLKSLGVRLALDDFGTGYSSLARLQRLPLDEVKIDRSFLEQTRQSGDTGVIAAIASLGRHLGLTVVAEGAELEAELGLLASLGCHLVQGYALARPMPADELRSWLESRLSDARIRSRHSARPSGPKQLTKTSAEIRPRLRKMIDQTMAEGDTLQGACESTLAELSKELQADFAAWWQTSDDPERQQALHCTGVWLAPSISASRLADMTRAMSYAPGVGLPGRALVSEDAIWIQNLSEDENYPRASAAAEGGLTHGLAIPLRTDGKVLGVLEFMGSSMRAPDEQATAALTSTGAHLAKRLARRKAIASADLNAQVLSDLLPAFRELSIAAPEDLARRVCEQALHIAGADIVLLWTPTAVAGALEVRASAGWPGPPPQTNVLNEGSAVSSVYASQSALYVADTANDPITSRRLGRSLGARAALFQPVPGETRSAGVLCVVWRQPRPALPKPTAAAIELLADFASQIAGHQS
jgi:EAL domain-containing protein (putative c-di-GMP-specific phosphodiesterase class I)/GAF domain-containing protein